MPKHVCFPARAILQSESKLTHFTSFKSRAADVKCTVWCPSCPRLRTRHEGAWDEGLSGSESDVDTPDVSTLCILESHSLT